jgi:hypothetical protein
VRRRGFAAYRAARGVGPQRRVLPDFLLIGGQRCGTTSLHRYLSAHPQVAMAFRKEVSFFDVNWPRGEDWYRSHFPSAYRLGNRVVGEATPYYLFHPAVPARVRAIVPSVKLVAVLREPVARAHSGYRLQRAIGMEPLGFAEAIAAEADRLAGEADRLLADPGYRSVAHRHFSYQARGLYAEQLRRWFAEFPREQLLVLRSDDLFSDPGGTLSRVHAFLGIDDRPAAAYPVAQNATRGDDLDPTTDALLRERFAEPNRRLWAVLGEDWGWNDR